MLTFLSLLIMLMVAYARSREGLFAAATLFVNVILAGILTCHFWEPLADELEIVFAGGILEAYEDALAMTLLFIAFLILLRAATGKLVPTASAFSGYVQQAGGAVFGLLTGYLVAGFLVVALETLPWHENFLNFRPRSAAEAGLRRWLPPDRAWLALMRHAGAVPLAWKEEKQDGARPSGRYQTFDSGETFELRYLRYRRHGDNRDPLDYEGELDRELGKEKPR